MTPRQKENLRRVGLFWAVVQLRGTKMACLNHKKYKDKITPWVKGSWLVFGLWEKKAKSKLPLYRDRYLSWYRSWLEDWEQIGLCECFVALVLLESYPPSHALPRSEVKGRDMLSERMV